MPHQQVEAREIRNVLHDAAKQFDRPAPPRLAYVVVTKRIAEDFGAQGGSQPCVGGVAVTDAKICTPNDFYLVSHKGIGFVHYCILPFAEAPASGDENIPREEVMMLAYNTAFQYFNWPGPIKIPAALQYAHCVSKMGGQWSREEG
jgi:hypothetical protein